LRENINRNILLINSALFTNHNADIMHSQYIVVAINQLLQFDINNNIIYCVVYKKISYQFMPGSDKAPTVECVLFCCSAELILLIDADDGDALMLTELRLCFMCERTR